MGGFMCVDWILAAGVGFGWGGVMGVYLSTPKTEKYFGDGENDRLRYGLASMQGWRTTMEDAHTALPRLDECTSFFGVYDGHGGKAVSKFCAKHLHLQVLKNEAYSSGDLATSVSKSFFRMDEMMKGQRGWRELAELGDKGQKFAGMLEGIIWSPKPGDSDKVEDSWTEEVEFDQTALTKLLNQGPHSHFPGPTSGSTACVAIIRNDELIVANAGDSRCVLSRKGQAHDLSKDHKPDLDVEKERIMNAGGFVVAGRVNGSLNLTRAIGDMELKQNELLPAERQIVTAEPELKTVKLSEDDEFIILACDGIWDCMSSQEVVDFVHEEMNTEDSLSAVCEKLLDRCLAPVSGGDGCDNMTVILVQFKKPSKSATTSSSNQSASSEEMRPK
uniref:protein-serine/threonine phosphatase n=1 Tax=Leersia perrieri TaxID=77586 RepID=A0A0D9XGN6_9ORYZ